MHAYNDDMSADAQESHRRPHAIHAQQRQHPLNQLSDSSSAIGTVQLVKVDRVLSIGTEDFMTLYCQGCIERIHKILPKTKGVQDMNIDKDHKLSP